MFQCHSPKSSHSRPLPQSPRSDQIRSVTQSCPTKDCSILYQCFSFWLTSLCIIGSSFIHLIRTDSNVFFFNGWILLHCVYVPQLSYPFICWWASRLLPYPGYYKQCCDEQWGTRVSFNSGFLGVYAQQWDYWVIRQFYFQFFQESPHCSP